MRRLVIDAKAVTKNVDGLGFYSIFFVKRLISHFRNKCEICIILPPSAKNTNLFDAAELQYVNLRFDEDERFKGDRDFDFHRWDSFVGSLKPDIYISTAFLPTNYSCVTIVVIHDVAPIVYPDTQNPNRVRFYSKVIEEAVSNSDLIIAASNNTADDISSVFPHSIAEIKVLYPDIEALVGRIRPKARVQVQEHGRFLVVGVKCPRKNVQLVIEALKVLKRRNISFCKVYFIGNLRQDVPLARLVKENSLEEEASVLGYVSDERLRRLVYGSKGLLFPSQYEGFGIPLVEFLAANKPIICTANSSIPEVVGDVANYTSNDPFAFADAILKVHHETPDFSYTRRTDRQLRKLVSINRTQFGNVFSWIATQVDYTL